MGMEANHNFIIIKSQSSVSAYLFEWAPNKVGQRIFFCILSMINKAQLTKNLR